MTLDKVIVDASYVEDIFDKEIEVETVITCVTK